MPVSIASIIDLIHPASSGTNIIVRDDVWVLFDREMDETTIAGGNFFVTGPDFDTWSGPDLALYHDTISRGSESEILESPGYHGLVQGTVTFDRIHPTNDDLSVTTEDSIGSGLLYRTKAIFSPTSPFAANTEYKVNIIGDESATDSLTTGCTEKTIYDSVASGINTTTGTLTLTGSYTESYNDIFHIKITTAGDVDTARFKYSRDSVGIWNGPYKTRRTGTLLSDGVTISFSDDDYYVDDAWYFRVKSANTFSGNLFWVFETGTGSIQAISDTVSTSIIGDAIATTTATSSSSAFSVSSTDPADEDSHTEIIDGPNTISIVFNDDIDATTVTSGVSVLVFTEPVNGDTGIDATGICIAEPSVSGDTLTITVASGELLENNLVTVTLDSTIASTGGDDLGSDYEFSYTTTYNPYYCTLRKLRLEVGAFISAVPDDTVNFAIFESSLMADNLIWNTDNSISNSLTFAKSQWVCCKSQEILLVNTVGGSGALKSKKLGDLEVEYNSGASNEALARAVACLDKWEKVLQSGGASIQLSANAVKGAADYDRPSFGRKWYNQNTGVPGTPAANVKVKYYGSRRYRSVYTRNTGSIYGNKK